MNTKLQDGLQKVSLKSGWEPSQPLLRLESSLSKHVRIFAFGVK